ncbi:hypothetical protein EMWEY_00019330 [Eimeria maxima]|uniref:Uncharacterized protein n=1 Tax=Eimeria maxima TaxID=5804 RepID=U6MBD8_EIMMA|nr:hypothetical protein EMWEY_00019330 [Eimeria maxima]CDJ58980.1 hypothetical protein EMWEY_00019330 [Eimeria maxima]
MFCIFFLIVRGLFCQRRENGRGSIVNCCAHSSRPCNARVGGVVHYSQARCHFAFTLYLAIGLLVTSL